MKRIFTLLLALSMLFVLCTSLSACGDDDSATNNTASLGESADSELSDNVPPDVVDSSADVTGAETSEDEAQSELVTLYLYSKATRQYLDDGDYSVLDFTYDEQLKTFSCSVNGIDNGEVFEVVKTMTYDENGNLTEMVSYINGEEDYRCTYAYDENGNKTEEVHYYSNGEERYRYTCAYDESGNKTEEVHYTNGEELHRETWTYDENGNKTEEVHYYSNGEERYRYTYAYDESGNVTEEVYYDDGEEYDRATWVYDEMGNITQCELEGRSITVAYIAVQVSAERAEEIEKRYQDFLSFMDLI